MFTVIARSVTRKGRGNNRAEKKSSVRTRKNHGEISSKKSSLNIVLREVIILVGQNMRSALDHNHGSVTHTSCDHNHAHQCLDISGPAIPMGNSHVHRSEGYVLYEYGHAHYYSALSGPSIPLKNGWHVHNWYFYTSLDNGHRHRVSGVDMPAPGI